MSKRIPKHLTRRAFLGGAGALLTLPLLESITPRFAAAQGTPGEPARRMLAYYVPNGIHMPAWTPEAVGQGAAWSLSPILEPLSNVKNKLLLLSGIANEPARPDGAGDHAGGTGGFLTATHVNKTEGADIRSSISVDQIAAQALGTDTRFASLQLGIDGGGSVGNCDSGYSCAYVRNISWAGPQTPLAKTVNPRVVFDRLFAGFDSQVTAAERAKRQRYSKSILDYVLKDAQNLNPKLNTRDKIKLDEYMTGIRELEMRINATEDGPQCIAPDAPPPELGFQEHLTIMADLMVMAFQCDLTRVITFMLGNAGSTRSYNFLGIPDAHHEISHHQNSQTNFDKLQTINTFEVAQLAYLLDAMDRVEEENGSTLLDNSLVFFSSEISDGNRHNHDNLPVILAGSQRGQITTDRHVRYDNDEPIADLFLSMLSSVGVEQDSFGDNSTGQLAGILNT